MFTKMVSTIKATYRLSLTDIAEVLGTSRQSVYSWMSEVSVPRRKVVERLSEIYECCKDLKTPLPKASIYIKFDGVSLLDAVKRELISQEEVSEIVRRIREIEKGEITTRRD